MFKSVLMFMLPILFLFNFSVIDSYASDRELNSKLIEFISEGNVDYVNKIIEKGADVNYFYPVPLNVAIDNMEVEIIKILLDHGAKPTEYSLAQTIRMSSRFKGPRMRGICRNMFDILIDHGADINSGAPLMAAIESKNKEYIDLLFEKGVDVNVLDDKQWTPLMHSVDSENIGLAKLLLEKGANINGFTDKLRSTASNTPLTLAIHKGNVHIVKLLLENGASTTMFYRSKSNRSFMRGLYPLCQASIAKDVSCDDKCNIVKLLIKYKAPLESMKNHQSKLPWEYVSWDTKRGSCQCLKETYDHAYLFPDDILEPVIKEQQ